MIKKFVDNYKWLLFKYLKTTEGLITRFTFEERSVEVAELEVIIQRKSSYSQHVIYNMRQVFNSVQIRHLYVQMPFP